MSIESNPIIKTQRQDCLNLRYEDGDVIIEDSLMDVGQFSDYNSDMFMLMLCKAGKAQLQLNGDLVQMERNQMLIIMPNSAVLDPMSSPDLDIRLIGIRSAIIRDFIQARKIVDLGFFIGRHPLLVFDEGEMQYMQTLNDAMQGMLHKEKVFSSQIMSRLLEILLIIVFGYYEEKNSNLLAPNTSEGSNNAERIFKKFISLLINQDIKPRHISFYSDQLCISAKYLSSCCRQVSGKGCSQWINEAVVKDIERYLRQSDLTYKEIVDRMNFPSTSFFCRYVKKNLGYTPSKYREKLRHEGK